MKAFILFEQNAAWILDQWFITGPVSWPQTGEYIRGTQNRFEPEIVEMDAVCPDKNK